jgi:hypothetical protein
MAEVLHTGQQRHKRWSASDQLFAEVAAACGVTIVDIGRLRGFSHGTVLNNLVIGRKAKNREYSSAYSKRRLHGDQREKILEQKREYYYSNKESISTKTKAYRQANKELIAA